MAVERIEVTGGDVVRKLRIKRGLTSHELAIKAEIAQSTLSVIESGGDYRTSNLKAVAAALGFTVTQLWHLVPEGLEYVPPSTQKKSTKKLA